MQPDDRRHFSRNTVAKVTTHGFAYHFTQFLNCVPLCSDGVSKSGGNITALGFILLNLKNDFAHEKTLFRPAKSRKP